MCVIVHAVCTYLKTLGVHVYVCIYIIYIHTCVIVHGERIYLRIFCVHVYIYVTYIYIYMCNCVCSVYISEDFGCADVSRNKE